MVELRSKKYEKNTALLDTIIYEVDRHLLFDILKTLEEIRDASSGGADPLPQEGQEIGMKKLIPVATMPTPPKLLPLKGDS